LRSLVIRTLVQRYPFLALLAALIGIAAASSRTPAQRPAPGNYAGISVEASPQIFATMCALDAAGLDVKSSTLGEMPARLALRAELLQMQGPATEALRQFYRDHALASPSETLSRYITFALVAGPPPQFQYPANRESLPPDVLTIEGFQELLANFYGEAHLRLSWAAVEAQDAPALARYRASLARIVTVSNAYLREVVKESRGRTFTVYVEPFVGTRTNFRNYGDRYLLVVGTPSQIPAGAIQHAYLHFLLDPLVLRNRPAVETKRALLQAAAGAPRLPVEYRGDFVGLADECLVKAVELRLRRLAPIELEEALRDADESGFVLVRPLVGKLQKFEKAEPAMSYYFPDLIAGLDVRAEQKRLQGVTFAAGPALGVEQDSASDSEQPSELDRWVAEGNREIARKNGPAAASTFERALAKYPNSSRALYGLAIASVLSGKAERARELFEKVISSPNLTASASQESGEAADAEILAWSHVYLGRIHDLEEDRDLAVKEYRAALTVEGAPATARAAAQTGVETAYQPPERPGENKQPRP
jgi:tetratricopeptide (TPR) repeat protein